MWHRSRLAGNFAYRQKSPRSGSARAGELVEGSVSRSLALEVGRHAALVAAAIPSTTSSPSKQAGLLLGLEAELVLERAVEATARARAGWRARRRRRASFRCLGRGSWAARQHLLRRQRPVGEADSGRLLAVQQPARVEELGRQGGADEPRVGSTWPPSPGDRPRRVKLRPTLASRATSRMSHASATQKPAPMAAPFTAAMVGQGRRRTARNRARRSPA